MSSCPAVGQRFYRVRQSEHGAIAEYPATIVPDSTCAHIFKERDMCRNKLTQVAAYSAVKLRTFSFHIVLG